MSRASEIKPTISDAPSLGAFVEVALHHVQFDGFPRRLVLAYDDTGSDRPGSRGCELGEPRIGRRWEKLKPNRTQYE